MAAGDGVQPSNLDAALTAWLFGPDASWRDRAVGGPNKPPASRGLIERLLDFYQGDPCGPGSQLASLATATKLKVPAEARSALVSVSVSAVYMTLDGTVPSAANGVQVAAGALLVLYGQPTLLGASFLQVAAGAVVNAQYFT